MANKTKKFKPRHAIERTRDKNYTQQERVQLLSDIRDNSLDLVALAVYRGEATGTSAFLHCYEQACLHIDSICGSDSTSKDSGITITIAGYDDSAAVTPEVEA